MQGLRDHYLIGYGLVAGLPSNSGDRNSIATNLAQINMLENFGINIKDFLVNNQIDVKNLDTNNPLIAVITRATIKPSKLFKFWRYVPISQKPIERGCSGLIYTKGVGEAPVVQMATFSVWENIDALKNYAYNSVEHREAIKKTHQLDWYKEEMFTRFQPYKTIGIWEGKDLLAPYLKS